MNIVNMLEGHSKAMYSTYFLWKPDSILFDCGEGAATNLGSKVFAADAIFLSHGHLDHISGIPNFLFARSGGRGDNAKPLKIYYPEGDANIFHLIKFCDALKAHGIDALSFDLEWISLQPNQRIDLTQSKYITTFQTQHAVGRLTLGYKINEVRKKLKPEFQGLEKDQILEAIKQHGKDNISTKEEATTFVYSGDTVPLAREIYGTPQVLLHEATFIDKNDVKHNSHSILEDVLRLAKEINPSVLLLYHFSTRYSAAQVCEAVVKACTEMGVKFDVWLMYGNWLWKANPEPTLPS